jgi:hypothetical protein
VSGQLTLDQALEEAFVAALPYPHYSWADAERFWDRVTPGATVRACWTWAGSRHQFGYGWFWAQGKSRNAHRVAMEIARMGLEVDASRGRVVPVWYPPVERSPDPQRPPKGLRMKGQRGECELCGRIDADVRMALVRYAEEHQVDGKPFGSMPRCHNADECRSRTQANGDAWPLDDALLPTQGVTMRVGRQITPDAQKEVGDAFVPVAAAVLNADEVSFE